MSLWCMDTISFFCLDSDELYLRRLMLKDKRQRHAVCFPPRSPRLLCAGGRWASSVCFPTWRLSGPAAAFASPPSGSGWCATPGRRSSSEGCRPELVYGRFLWQETRAKRFACLLLFWLLQFVASPQGFQLRDNQFIWKVEKLYTELHEKTSIYTCCCCVLTDVADVVW